MALMFRMFECSFPKGNPKQISFRDYKTFHEIQFNKELHNYLYLQNITKYNIFEQIFIKVPDKHVSLKIN